MSDNLAALESLLDDLPGAVDRRKLGDRLSQTLEALRNANHQVGRINSVLALAEITEFGVQEVQNGMLEKLREEACGVGAALETAVTEGDLRDAIYDYERSFQSALVSAEKAIRAHWATLAADKCRAIELLGEMLERIDVAPELGQRLQDCARRGRASGSGGQLTDIVERARALLGELEDLQAERARTIGASDVGTFINALAENRATLALVTSEVHAWLTENQALERFSVAPR